MLDLVKSGVGLSLARESIALAQAHAHGLVIADAVQLSTVLSFVALEIAGMKLPSPLYLLCCKTFGNELLPIAGNGVVFYCFQPCFCRFLQNERFLVL